MVRPGGGKHGRRATATRRAGLAQSNKLAQTGRRRDAALPSTMAKSSPRSATGTPALISMPSTIARMRPAAVRPTRPTSSPGCWRCSASRRCAPARSPPPGRLDGQRRPAAAERRGRRGLYGANPGYLAANQPMQDVSELRLLAGMDAALYQRLLPSSASSRMMRCRSMSTPCALPAALLAALFPAI